MQLKHIGSYAFGGSMDALSALVQRQGESSARQRSEQP
jgi:hypothetical protein